MAVFKCKMCGGTLEFEPGATVGVCDYCGTKQTLPRLDDDRRVNLYDRANHFRRNNEFDKAAGIYEQILNEDTTDAEAYWSLVLCRYGIEYVEDPATHKRVPTVNRAQFTSIFDDGNYKSALQYADAGQRAIYEEEAAAINEIQKGILAISQKEEPFDVFICYKETDAGGRRTQDSVLANDLYHQLTQEGFKVFFSRITLEDKLGTAYEPYIFAALNSAKVMVVLGTKPEYFNAVWVKNEWSRYLSLVKQNGGKKVLIPAYRDMDPYDLPEEFSHLQAQDMSKLGFMQDLIRGIKKMVRTDEPKAVIRETVAVNTAGSGTAPLLRRAFMFLEDGEWAKADDFCEQVLNLDPENAHAYLGKLMAELHVRRQEDLPNCKLPFDGNSNFQKAVRFGGELGATLEGYITHINQRNELERLTGIYNSALSAMKEAKTEDAFKAAAKIFKTIPGFKDADALMERCLEQAEISRKDAIYMRGTELMASNSGIGYGEAIKQFQAIPGWKDADEQIRICKEKAEQATKKSKKTAAIITPILVACVAFIIVLVTVILPKQKLNKAMGLLESGEYDAAYTLLEQLKKDEIIAENKYNRAVALIDSKQYDEAIALLWKLDFSDSESQLEKCYVGKYGETMANHIVQIKNAQVGDIVVLGTYEQDNNTSNGKEEIEWLVLSKEDDRILVITKYAIGYMSYNGADGKTTWGRSAVRKYLNGTFLDSTFNKNELTLIQEKELFNYPDSNTTDRVFLLNSAEATTYFHSDSERQCQATAHVKDFWPSGNDHNANAEWLLRNSDHETTVWVNGNIHTSSNSEYEFRIYHELRPAMWISLEP